MILSPRIRLLGLLLLLPLLVGCGKEQDSSAELGSGKLRWGAFPVEILVDERILDDRDAEEDFMDAVNFWQARAGKDLFRVIGAWDPNRNPYTGSADDPQELLGNIVFLQTPWSEAPEIAGKTIVRANNNNIHQAVILINEEPEGQLLCAGDCNSGVSRKKLFAHELGHFLGFGHASSDTDVMYPEILEDGTLESLKTDQGLLLQLTI